MTLFNWAHCHFSEDKPFDIHHLILSLFATYNIPSFIAACYRSSLLQRSHIGLLCLWSAGVSWVSCNHCSSVVRSTIILLISTMEHLSFSIQNDLLVTLNDIGYFKDTDFMHDWDIEYLQLSHVWDRSCIRVTDESNLQHDLLQAINVF